MQRKTEISHKTTLLSSQSYTLRVTLNILSFKPLLFDGWTSFSLNNLFLISWTFEVCSSLLLKSQCCCWRYAGKHSLCTPLEVIGAVFLSRLLCIHYFQRKPWSTVWLLYIISRFFVICVISICLLPSLWMS